MMFVECSSAPMAAEQRLAAVIRETTGLKNTGEAAALELLVEASDWIPPALLGLGSILTTGAIDAIVRLGEVLPGVSRMFTLPPLGINFIATNVPGAQIPMYLAGRRMTSMIGCVPLAANIGYGRADPDARLRPDARVRRRGVRGINRRRQNMSCADRGSVETVG
jgi:hypothetical protein